MFTILFQTGTGSLIGDPTPEGRSDQFWHRPSVSRRRAESWACCVTDSNALELRYLRPDVNFMEINAGSARRRRRRRLLSDMAEVSMHEWTGSSGSLTRTAILSASSSSFSVSRRVQILMPHTFSWTLLYDYSSFLFSIFTAGFFVLFLIIHPWSIRITLDFDCRNAVRFNEARWRIAQAFVPEVKRKLFSPVFRPTFFELFSFYLSPN